MVKEARPLQSARFTSYTKAGVDHVEAFALLSNKDASDYFDLVLQSVRKGEQARVAAELFVKEMWYTVSRGARPLCMLSCAGTLCAALQSNHQQVRLKELPSSLSS